MYPSASRKGALCHRCVVAVIPSRMLCNLCPLPPTSSYGSQLCTIITLEPVENKWGMYNILIKDVHACGMWSEGLGVMDMPVHTCCVGGWWNAVYALNTCSFPDGTPAPSSTRRLKREAKRKAISVSTGACTVQY